MKWHRPPNLLLAVSLALTTSLVTPAAQAASSDKDAARKAAFAFRNAPPMVVLDSLGQLFQLQFDAAGIALKEPITISSGGQEVTAEQMLAQLNAALLSRGVAARSEGGVVRILPISLAAAKVEMIVLKHADPKEVVKIVLEIFQSRDLIRETTQQNAELVKKLLSDLKKENLTLLAGRLRISAVAYPRLKAIIIKAPQAAMGTIRRFIVEELDKPGPPKPKPPKPKPPKPKPPKPKPLPVKTRVFTLNYVPAQYVRSVATSLWQVSPYVEERTNSLILRTNKYAQFDQLLEVIKLLDVPDSVREETYHVTLRNATAQEVRSILNELFRRSFRLPFTEKGLRAVTAEEKERRVQDTTRMMAVRGVSEEATRELVETNLGTPFGSVYIVADRANNALLIRTNPRNYKTILRIIDELDRPQTQVFIKVFIAEVTLGDTKEIGHAITYNDFLVGDIHANTSTLRTEFPNLGGLPQSSGLTYSLISANITSFFRLLQNSTRLEVISTPHILTLNNVEAKIEFGKSVPLLQTTHVTEAGAVSSTVRYKSVSTKLVVTPHVNAAGFIYMRIQQTINDISSDTFAISENLAPRILITREATTSVQVRDGQTVCLGGFINDTLDEAEVKIPLLGDIPLLGYFFKTTKKERVKSELLIFLTPYVLQTPEELLAMTNQRRQETAIERRKDLAGEELTERARVRRNIYRHPTMGTLRNTYTLPSKAPARPAEPPTKAPSKATSAPATSRPAER